MFTCSLVNGRGEELVLTGKEPMYQVVKIIGLNPPSAHLNMSTVVGLDGARYNSGRLNTRNIVLTVRINGNVEDNRQNLYRFCPTKEKVRFNFSNNNRSVYADGYVESVECGLFTISEQAQISIICPQPYFMDTEETAVDGNSIVGLFTFPFSIDYDDPIPFSVFVFDEPVDIYNRSESAVGMIIDIDVNDDMSALVIRNIDTNEYFSLAGTFLEGDHIRINTIKGEKSVTLTRNAAESNLFSAMQRGSTFFQLLPGSNQFTYTVGGDALNNAKVSIMYTFYRVFRGV